PDRAPGADRRSPASQEETSGRGRGRVRRPGPNGLSRRGRAAGPPAGSAAELVTQVEVSAARAERAEERVLLDVAPERLAGRGRLGLDGPAQQRQGLRLGAVAVGAAAGRL